MSKIIKNLKVSWSWNGDFYALQGFNIAITPTSYDPTENIVCIAEAKGNVTTYTFSNVTIDSGIQYTAWVQALYPGGDSNWISTGNITVSDDGSATIATANDINTVNNTNIPNAVNQGQLYLRGVCLNRGGNRILKLSGNDIYNTTGGRGLRCCVIKRSDLSIVSTTDYDVYGGATYQDNLATALNALDDTVIVTLTSYDAISTNANLITAIARCGGSGNAPAGGRTPFAFVGIPGINQGAGLEVVSGQSSTSPYAEISTKIINGIPQGIDTTRSTIINNLNNTNNNVTTAQNTANSKRRVFNAQPLPPYDVGDLWITNTAAGQGDLYNCITARSTGSYNSADWIKSVKYTDDTAVNNLVIGGTNLLLNSNYKFGFNNWSLFGSPTITEILTVSQPTFSQVLHLQVTGANQFYTQDVGVTAGNTYCISFIAHVLNNPCGIQIFLHGPGMQDTNASNKPEPNSDYTKYYFLQTIPAGYTTMTIQVGAAGGIPNSGPMDLYISNIKVEIGTKPSDWSPSPIDAQSLIDAMSNDNLLTPLEKQEARKEMDSIINEKSNFDSQADTLGVTTEKTNYDNAYNTLYSYVNPLVVDSQLNTTSSIVGSTFRTDFSNYYSMKAALQAALVTKANNLTSTAQSTANSKRRVFTSTPITPYDVGDLWSQGSSGDLMKCVTARSSGAYVSGDWALATKYTDDTTVNNLDIGGKNLLTNSGYTYDIDGTLVRGTYNTLSLDTTNIYNNNNSLKIVASAASISGSQDIWQQLYDACFLNYNVIVSFYVKGSIATTGWIRLAGATATGGMISFNITTSWTKVSIYLGTISAIGTKGATEMIYGFNSAGTYNINSMKLEYGNRPTAWTPAPEDINTSIQNVDAKVTTAQQKILPDAIVNTVSQTISSQSADVYPIKNNSSGITYSTSFVSTVDTSTYSGQSMVSNKTNDYTQYTFVGTGINLYFKKGTDQGIAQIYVDNVSQGNFDCYNSSNIYKYKLFATVSLTYGTHTVKIVVTGTKNASSTGTSISFDYLEILNGQSAITVSNFGSQMRQSIDDFTYSFNQMNSAKVSIDTTGLHVSGGTITGSTVTLGGGNNGNGTLEVYGYNGEPVPIISLDNNGIKINMELNGDGYLNNAFSVSSYVDGTYTSLMNINGEGVLEYNGTMLLWNSNFSGTSLTMDRTSLTFKNATGSYLITNDSTITSAGTGQLSFLGESHFCASGTTYSDPWSGTLCAIKTSGNIAATGDIQSGSTFRYSNGDKAIRGRWGISDICANHIGDSGPYFEVWGLSDIWAINVWKSDVSLKQNIMDTTVNALDKINQIKHRQFNWKSDNKLQRLGIISQELEEIEPSWVIGLQQPNGSVLKQPYEPNIIPYITKAIHELDEKINNVDIGQKYYTDRAQLSNGTCTININPIFMIVADTTQQYEVQTWSYGDWHVYVKPEDMHDTYFTVSGDGNTPFGYTVIAKNKQL